MSFVVSSGRVQALQALPSAWGSVTPPVSRVQISSNYFPTYERLFETQPALRTVIGFIARNVAQLGLEPYRRDGKNRVKLVDHPLNRLLEQPVPGSKWTKYRLLSWTMHEWCIFDEAFWLKMRLPDGRRAVLPIPRRHIQPADDNWVMPKQYRINGNGGEMLVNADELVHFHGYSPQDTRSGVSPIETLRSILAEEYAANQFREQMWRNGARVAGYIRRPTDAPDWSDAARTRFKRDWQAQYSGDGPATGGTPILEDGMEFVGAGVSPRDAQYVESRRLTSEECARAYYVNPVMLGLEGQGATHSSFTEQHKMLYQDSLGPWLTAFAQDIECQLLPDFEEGTSSSSIYLEFNLAEKLRGSFEEQAAAISASVGGPWMTRSEARAMQNLEHLAEADELIVPMNVTQGGLASPRDTAPDNPANAESNGQLPKPKPTPTLAGSR